MSDSEDTQTPLFKIGSIPNLSALAWEIIDKYPNGAQILCLTQDQSEELRDELQTLLDANTQTETPRVFLLPGLDIESHTQRRPAIHERSERLRFFYHLVQAPAIEPSTSKYFIRTLSSALERGNVNPFAATAPPLTIKVGGGTNREQLLVQLRTLGYEEAEIVEIPGQFAARGSVVDIYSFLNDLPTRIDLNEDVVQTIASFDPHSQMRAEVLDHFELLPARDFVPKSTSEFRSKLRSYLVAHSFPIDLRESALTLLEADSFPIGFELWSFLENSPPIGAGILAQSTLPNIVVDPGDFFGRWRFVINQSEKKLLLAQSVGDLAPRPEDFFYDPTTIHDFLNKLRNTSTLLSFHAKELGQSEIVFQPSATQGLDLTSLTSDWKGHFVQPFAEKLIRLLEQYKTHCFFHSVSQFERLEFLLSPYHVPALKWSVGALKKSFQVPGKKLAFVSETDLLGSPTLKSRRAKNLGKTSKEIFFRDIREGDMVVHSIHGVGQYLGLKSLAIQGRNEDLIELQYKDGKIFVPVQHLRQIHRYSSAEVSESHLDKLGGVSWKAKKDRVRKEILKFAGELLTLYAQRTLASGIKMTPPLEKIEEFAASFPFDETPDQEKAIEAILKDLASGEPMDRVLCGDVGYGKTEVALRATHAVLAAGHQVAVLSPTTLLTAQHEKLFRTRLSEFGFKVGSLSRFNSDKKNRDVIAALKSGEISVVVGTHKLLNPEVAFKSLGLIVVDEEQRFGVMHKEKLKKLRTNVHVLSMTATPIPRTLSMALSGIRQFSVMTTPPQDRLSVKTHIVRKNADLIRDAIDFEVRRGGQVFYLFNRVRGIEKTFEDLVKLNPALRIDFAHGQMDETKLEDKMLKFYRGETQVLVTTTIIEAGLDVSNANTLIVENAANFGLSQLYQIRGRVGRSDRKAYAYLLLPETGAVTPLAAERLGVLELYQELGSGFTIASHDLDLRGAGEILGDSQSGHLSLVGSETYFELLQEAIAELKGEALERDFEPDVQLNLDIAIPETYVKEATLRLSIYRRFSSAANEEAVDEFMAELEDRFGSPPANVVTLSRVMKILCVMRRLRVRSLNTGKNGITVVFDPSSPLPREKIVEKVLNYPKHFQILPDSKLLIKNPGGVATDTESILRNVDSTLSQFETLVN